MPEKFSGENFLRKKYWSRKEFRKAVEKSAKKTEKKSIKPEDKILIHLKRIEKILERKGEFFKEISLYPKFIIKAENIPSDYFKNFSLANFAEQRGYTREQLENPDIRKEIIKQFEKETGKDFNTYQVPKEEKERLTQQIIEDQKRSLDYWLDYLTSPEAKENYPSALRYWVFAEILKLGNFDPERKTFNERTKNTVAPFPPLNQQSLAIVFDEILRKYSGQPSFLILTEEQKREFQQRLQSENFANLYGWALDYIKSLTLPKERLPIIEGEWKLFERNSDPKELVKSIQNFPTGWCIAGEATAQNYLFRSNILIYFSQDKHGKNTIPRVAVVFNEEGISEVRGIAQSQNLDQYITPVVEEKLKELPGGEYYLRRTEDMKKLSEIYLKHTQGMELTLEELQFIYEIDRPIESFGYRKDPRINEILKTRNIRKDLAKIFNCQEEKISLNEEEALQGNIVYHYGNLDLWKIKSAKGLKLPKSISGSLIFRKLKSVKGLDLSGIKIGGDLNLGMVKLTKGLDLSKTEIRGSLYLWNLNSAEGLKLPKSIGGSLHFYRLKSADGLDLSGIKIGGSLHIGNFTSVKVLDLSEVEIGGELRFWNLKSAKGLKLPKSIGGSLTFMNLTSAEGLDLSGIKIGENLHLHNLTSAEGLDLSEVKIGGDLDLSELKSAKGLKLPKSIGGNLIFINLESAEGLDLSEVKIGGWIHFGESLTIDDFEKIRRQYPHFKFDRI